MSNVTNPSPGLLGELAAAKPEAGKKVRSIKVPPMPKAVAEKLQSLDVKPSLSQDGKQLVGDAPAQAASEQPGKDMFPDIPQEDRAAFLAHLLGAPHYKKSYELYGGALVLTFRTRSGSEEEACARAAQRAVPEPVIPDEITPEVRLAAAQASAERLRLYRELTMVVSLCDIRWDNRPPMSSLVQGPIEKVDLVAIRDEFIKTVPGTLLGTVRMYHDRFEVLSATMIGLADKPGFWSAVSAS